MGCPVSAATTCPILGRTDSVGAGRGGSVAHPASGQIDAKTSRTVALRPVRRSPTASSRGPTRLGTLRRAVGEVLPEPIDLLVRVARVEPATPELEV
jgi:hypothetical protein